MIDPNVPRETFLEGGRCSTWNIFTFTGKCNAVILEEMKVDFGFYDRDFLGFRENPHLYICLIASLAFRAAKV